MSFMLKKCGKSTWSMQVRELSHAIAFAQDVVEMFHLNFNLFLIRRIEDSSASSNEIHEFRFFFLVSVLLHSMTFIYLTFIITSGTLNRLTSRNITHFMRQPIQIELFVDEDEYFLYILMFINICIISALTILLAVDLELNIIIGHACTMFAVVG